MSLDGPGRTGGLVASVNLACAFDTIGTVEARELIAVAAAALAGLTALLYLLIGLNIVSLGEISPNEQRAFGFPAATVFTGGAVVAAVWDERWMWITGASGLALIMTMYFSLASQRNPRFERWGILIRVVQTPLIVALVYLAATNPAT
jgi:hypothetical protein